MRLFFIAFALFTVSLQVYCQKNILKNPALTQKNYDKLKELYIKNLDSRSHRDADSLQQVFNYKLTSELSLAEISKQNDVYLDWAKANISKTEFKDFAEAEKLNKAFQDALTASTKENKEYYDYLIEILVLEGGVDMSMAVQDDVRENYPEKFKRLNLPIRQKKSDFYPKLPGQL